MKIPRSNLIHQFFSLGAISILVAFLVQPVNAQTNLVINGGFEAGPSSTNVIPGWTNVDNFVADNTWNPPNYFAYSGNNFLGAGCVSSPCATSQTINSLTVGRSYGLSFYLASDGYTPSNFTVTFGSRTLLSLIDSAAFPYTRYFYTVTPTSSSVLLSFSGQNDPRWWILDDISLYELGPSAADTQLSQELSANRLKNVYALQTAAITSGLTYDCSIFDKNDICVSAGGRYNRVNTGETKAANGLLIGAYRVNPNVHLGAWVDQNLSVNTDTGVSLSNSKPMFGLFGVWNANPSGQGLELKVAAGYGDKDLTVTRDAIGASGEAGTGTTRLNTQGVSAVVSYNLPVNTSSVVSPYLGMRYTKLRAGGYMEETSSAVTTPLTYSELKQESSTALAGVKLSSKLMPNFGVFGGIGAELDTTTRGNNYSATGVDGLTPIAFNPNIKRLRGSANAGFYLDIDKTQRISLSTAYREEAFTSTSTLSSMLTYTAGF